MRRRSLKAIACTAAVTLAGGVACATGCSSTKPTELVPGALSQVQVPRDLQTIELDVTAEGATKFCEYVSVFDGKVELPRTLGVVSGESPNTVVTVTIRGYTGSMATAGSGNCPDTTNINDPSGNGPVVLRRSIQTFVGGHTLFLPMPLSFSCFNTDCSGAGSVASETSCAASRCVDLTKQDPVANAGTLVDFSPELFDGTGVCFDPGRCFSDGGPAVPVAAGSNNDASMGPSDATTTSSDCTYTFANPALTQLPGINVRIFYQDYRWRQNGAGQYVRVVANGGEEEILNEDPDEGFTVSADGTQFTLAPGLCDLVKNATTPPAAPSTGTLTYHTISAIQAASGCPSKPPLLPLCAGQQNVGTTLADGGLTPNLPDGNTTTDGKCNVAFPLTPAPSVMYMVMDDSAVMHAAFGSKGYATALGLSLTDPIFKQTSAAFTYLPHLDSECAGLDPDGGLATAFTNPQFGFTLASQAQPAIADKLITWMPPDSEAGAPAPLDLGAAMRLDTGAYAEVASYVNQVNEIPAVAAAMFFTNRVPVPQTTDDGGTTGNDCPLVPPATSALQALENKALAAYQAKPSMQTFFVVLDDDAHDGPAVALPFYQQMQTDLPQAVTVIDATSQSATTVLGNFEQVVERLGTCLYELPEPITNPEQIDVTYQSPPPPGSPIGAGPVEVPVDTGCSAATQDTANGWNIDVNGRIRICGQPCADLRTAITVAGALALQAGQSTPPDVPVNAAVRCGVQADAAEPAPLEDAATLFPPVAEAGADAGTAPDAGIAADAATSAQDAAIDASPDSGDAALQ